jgi:integrase
VTKSVRMRLGAASVRNIKGGGGEQTLYLDQDLKGFCVVASGVEGCKVSYAVQREVKGKTRRVTIAQVGSIPFKDAKDRAGRIIADMMTGIDPKGRSKTGTLAEALEAYLKTQHNLRPKSVLGYREAIGRLSKGRWLNLPLAEITREMVEEEHKDIAKRIAREGRYSGKAAANASMRALRAVWNFAADRDPELKAKGNPVRLRKQWFEIEGRETIIEDKHQAPFYAAVSKLPNAIQRDYILTLLYTGLRREEAASLRWENVDFDDMKITIPKADTKSKKQLPLPITRQLKSILLARYADRWAGNPFVFPSDSSSGHIAEPKFAFAFAAKTHRIPYALSCHALRHTFVTVAERTPGIPPAICRALVNHAEDRSTVHNRYIHLKVAELREPAQRIADHMSELCGLLPARSQERAG